MPVTRREQGQKIGCAGAVVLAETTSAPQNVAGDSGSVAVPPCGWLRRVSL